MNGVVIIGCLVALVLLLPLLILITKDDAKSRREQRANAPTPASPTVRVRGEPAPAGVRCPACQSQQVVKVPLGRRVSSGVAGGLVFSRAARAQFQCQSCEYFF